MISQIGKVAIEVLKDVEVIQKVEKDGEIKEEKKEVAIRFEFLIPMGVPYETVHEAIDDVKKEITAMEDDSKKRDSSRRSEEAKKQAEEAKEDITEKEEN